jgi:hypothetical protein
VYGEIDVDATGTGTITLQKGTNSLSAQLEIIGVDGTGHLIHGSGSNAIGQSLIVGFHQGSLGTYDLNSGSLSALVSEIIGQGGTGTLTQSAGENKLLRGTLVVGYGSTGSGTYNLKSGKLSALNEFIGFAG